MGYGITPPPPYVCTFLTERIFIANFGDFSSFTFFLLLYVMAVPGALGAAIAWDFARPSVAGWSWVLGAMLRGAALSRGICTTVRPRGVRGFLVRAAFG